MRSDIYIPDFSLSTKYHRRTTRNPSQALQRSQWKYLTWGYKWMDTLMIMVGFVLAYLVRFNANLPFFYVHEENSQLLFYFLLGLLLLPIWRLTFRLYGLYAVKENLCRTRLFSKLFSATTIPMFVLIVVDFLVNEITIARGWIILIWGFVYLLTIAGRIVMQAIFYRLRLRGYFLIPTIIVGANEESRLLAGQFLNERYSGLQLAGFVADGLEAGTPVLGDLTVLGSLSEVEAITREIGVQEVIVTSSAVNNQQILSLFQLFGMTDEVTMRLSSGLYEIITTGLEIDNFASVPLVKVNEFRLTGVDHFLKFMLDISFALAAMVFVIPLTIVLGILIKLDSPGPIFHRRRVMGVKGKEIDALKFRTMYVNGNEILEDYPELKKKLETEHKLKDDPRVTRIGRIIRTLSLDEFPQFFNVLRGEMSVVGPRMISPEEMVEYRKYGMNLLTVRPGITGLWQVSGRSDITYQERVQMDMYYIRNWSIWMDLQLIFRTPQAMISRRGAY